MALAADDAAYADDILDRTILAACSQASATGASFDEAMLAHLRYLRQSWPSTYAVVVARLHETNSDLVVYAEDGRTH